MAENQQEVRGLALRGADGGIYFIPETQLRQYRLTDEAAAEVEELLQQGTDVEGYGYLNVSVVGSFTFILPPSAFTWPTTVSETTPYTQTH